MADSDDWIGQRAGDGPNPMKKDPAGQEAHAERPLALTYIPPAQFEQVPALFTALILPCKQKEHEETPESEYVPAMQEVHEAVGNPEPVKYVPAVQD